MSLNCDGIEKLKADLRANAIHYNQNNFGNVTSECGTTCCISGLCYMNKVGLPAFTKEFKDIIDHDWVDFEPFTDRCLEAGAEQIGLTLLDPEEYEALGEDEGFESDSLPPIFSSVEFWPNDLQEKYQKAMRANDHLAKAEVACEALDRINEFGIFVERA